MVPVNISAGAADVNVEAGLLKADVRDTKNVRPRSRLLVFPLRCGAVNRVSQLRVGVPFRSGPQYLCQLAFRNRAHRVPWPCPPYPPRGVRREKESD